MRLKYWGWHIAASLVLSGTVAISIVGAFALTLHYVAPSGSDPVAQKNLTPLVENGWIKMPFDIIRKRECLANSTITLRRMHDYGAPLGVREDTIVLGLYNTTITAVGKTHSMLWFEIPAHVESGEWSYESKTQDDCGGIGDLFNFSLRHPRSLTIPNVLIIPPGA